MSWIKSTLIIVFNTIVLLLILNIALVYFSPSFIYQLGGSGISKLKTEKCFRTFAYDNLSQSKNGRKQILVLGDSYSEGMGDEFLTGDSNFGLIRKIDAPDTDYIVAGRTGYGTLGAYNESVSCLDSLNRWTSWEYNPVEVSKVLIMFYEGNDLNDNLNEVAAMNFGDSLSGEREAQLYFPILQMIQTAVLQFRHSLKNIEPERAGKVNITKSGVTIPGAIQSAATELSEEELASSFGVVEKVITLLKKNHPKADIEVLYLPSVASSYQFDDLKIQTYQKGPSRITGNENTQRSLAIKALFKNLCSDRGQCSFCDASKAIQDATEAGAVVHGPLDWKHFNKLGYELVSQAYSACH